MGSTSYPRRYVSKLVPSSPAIITALIVATSAVDSTLLGYDSSLMGSLNVMPTYTTYFTLTTATKSLNTAASYVGGACAALPAGWVTDWRGRRETVAWSCVLTLIGAVIQAAAQNVGMFIAGRFLVGFGLGFAATATPTYVAETAPQKWRGFALGLYYACWGVGTLVASGVCYGTQNLPTTWAWRTPSLLQTFWSLAVLLILPFIPDSPRWLMANDRPDAALEVLAILNADGDVSSPAAQLLHTEIRSTLSLESPSSSAQDLWTALAKPVNRKRLLIAVTFSAIVMLPGTNIITYYFGTMLSEAGISSPTRQLQINVILTAWTLVVSIAGAYTVESLPRKLLCVLSLAGQIAAFAIFAALSAVYGGSSAGGGSGSGDDKSGIYGAIAMIFIYNAFYGWGITPLTVLYAPEILPYRLRAVGMGAYTFTTKLCGLLVTMVFPFALSAIGWKTYVINVAFDVLMAAGVVIWWVETRGLTLEEVDGVFEGVIVGREAGEEVGMERVVKIEGKGVKV